MVDRILESFPVGVGFHPTDEQLVAHYLIPKLRDDHSHLKMKIPGTDSQVDIIPVVDVCKCKPEKLQRRLKHPVFSKFPKDEDESESFFFSPLEKKYAKGDQFKRATKNGFWKPTGRDRIIKRQGTREVIGTKKTLVFHKGRWPSAVGTAWVIHEYHAHKRFVPDDKTYYVVCRLKTEAGNGILIDQSGSPAETKTFGASNIAPDITNCKLDPKEYAPLDGSPVDIDLVGCLCERVPLDRSPVPVDRVGYLCERAPLDGSVVAIDLVKYLVERPPLDGPPNYERAPLDGPPEDEFANVSVGYPYERAPLDGSPNYEFAFDSDGYPYERLIRKS